MDSLTNFGEIKSCFKCGHDVIGIEWIKRPDLLLRTCDRCGYNWKEKPLDANDSGEDPARTDFTQQDAFWETCGDPKESGHMVRVIQSDTTETYVRWMGYVKDSDPHLFEMTPVLVPRVKRMRYHGEGFEFTRPLILKGYTRNLTLCGVTHQCLFLLTKSLLPSDVQQPVLATGSIASDISKIYTP